MRTICLIIAAAAALAVCTGAGPLEKARRQAEEAGKEPVVIRMYDVQDLVLRRDFPYRSYVMPPTSTEATVPWTEYAAREGSFGDLFGVGAAEEEERERIATTLSPGVLVDLIMRTIDPVSWETDPRIRIDRVGALLVVTQTEPNHARIEELLEQFRVARPMLSIEARWLLIPQSNLRALIEDARRQKPRVPRIVTQEALTQAKATVAYQAQLTCFDRQTVHVASGRGQTLITDAEPVVAEAAAGWDPTIEGLLWGALLEVTPALSPDKQRVTLKVHSAVTEGMDVATRTIESGVGDQNAPPVKVQVDLPEFLMHTFRTSVRAPLEQPVLIGGITAPEAVDGSVIYLVLEVSAFDELPGVQAPEGKKAK